VIWQLHKLLNCAKTSVRTGAADTFHPQKLGGVFHEFRIAMFAEQHGYGAVPPKKKGAQDMFVPKHQNIFSFGNICVNSGIVKSPLEINRSNQRPKERSPQKASGSTKGSAKEGIRDFHKNRL